MKNKKNKKIVFALLLIFIISLVGVISYKKIYKSKNIDIEKILKTDSYSYLSKEAKDYIKEAYERTGEVILTEKNKEENTPYLNPKYDSYLALSEEEKQDVEVIPNAYVVDYIFNGYQGSTAYPSKYNLTNVNNNNYTTPMNDQGDLGICWAFATIEQAESYLMVKNSESYSSSSQRFSVRQLDYAASSDGINNYENENGFRKLTYGGNFFMSSTLMSYGLSLHDYEEYNESTTKKELHDVLNYKKSNYELKSSIVMPLIISGASSEAKDAYNDLIKENVIEYGGANINTGSPTGSCGFKNIDGTYAIVDADNCVGSSGHAMQIIGWDDNYEYSYCKSGSNHTALNNSGICNSGSVVSGKGAWIVRNSWGENSAYKYVYLGYSSYEYEVNFITSLSSMDSRTWDNNYHMNFWKHGLVNKKTDVAVFSKKINTSEKIKEIKFMAASISGKYTVSIESNSNTYKDIKTINAVYPGIYTVDLSDENILLDDSQFKVTISSKNSKYVVADTISVFTSNIDSEPIIKTDNINIDLKSKEQNGDYKVIVYSSTKNIDSNETVTYSLHKDNNDLTNYIISYNNNIVAENNINATLIIDKNIPVGEYELRVHYNNNYYETNLSVPSTYSLQGTGTTDDPYLIYTEEDLNQIRFNLDSYYLLKNDITLTKNWVPIGTHFNPFRGGLDGGNHTIAGLKIDEQSDSPVGLFGYVDVKYGYQMQIQGSIVSYEEKTYIKNLRIVNAQVSNNNNAGILIGQVLYDTNNPLPSSFNFENPSFNIDNVHFIDGKVTSTSGEAGVIIGCIDIIPRGLSRPYLNINNVFSSVTISGNNSAGLIGYVNDSYESAVGIMLQLTMTNFQNVGIIDVKSFNKEYSKEDNYSPVVGGTNGNLKIILKNYVINSIFNDFKYMVNFVRNQNVYVIGYYNPITSSDFAYDISNGYYLSGYNKLDSKYTSAANIKNISSYSQWTNFDECWKMETVDGISRIPVLKGINYNYTSSSNITISKNDEVSLLDYITVKSDYQYIEYNVISNDDIIDVSKKTVNTINNGQEYGDIIIKALSEGEATIHVINNYDGYENDIKINVVSDVQKYVVRFDSNGGTGTMNDLEVSVGEEANLPKNIFERENYQFIGWSTSANGEVVYSDEGIINPNSDMTLYAQWTPMSNSSSITYDKDEIECDTYVIGTHMFDRSTNANYGGYLTTRVVMLAAKSIDSDSLNDMVIYYKTIDGDWVDALTGEEVNINDNIVINYVDVNPLDPEYEYNYSIPEYPSRITDTNEINNDTYIIGSHMFDRRTNGNYGGYLTTRVVMLAARTINSNELSDMVIYYKTIDGDWVDALTLEEVNIDNTILITHENALSVLQ